MDLAPLRDQLLAQEFRPLFATLSGAHLYGFESEDSDIDLRGAFVLPLESVVGLVEPAQTVVQNYFFDGTEMDLVCHDILKFCRLLAKRSGEVLEQLYSPLVVWDSPQLHELRKIGRPHIVKHFFFHYRGFLGNQLKLVYKADSTVKEMLYAYRVALSGIHLLRSGEVEANLTHLLQQYPQEGVLELLELKRAQREKTPLAQDTRSKHLGALAALEHRLQGAFEDSPLPDAAPPLDALHDFVVRVRLER
jgi:uncharacterized protein